MGRSYGMPEIDDDELEAEFDALGDGLLDEDSSYLDDAISAPSAPTGVPGADSVTNKVRGQLHKRYLSFNSLWHSNTIWWHWSGSTLIQLMASCLTAPTYYLNQR